MKFKNIMNNKCSSRSIWIIDMSQANASFMICYDVHWTVNDESAFKISWVSNSKYSRPFPKWKKYFQFSAWSILIKPVILIRTNKNLLYKKEWNHLEIQKNSEGRKMEVTPSRDGCQFFDFENFSRGIKYNSIYQAINFNKQNQLSVI